MHTLGFTDTLVIKVLKTSSQRLLMCIRILPSIHNITSIVPFLPCYPQTDRLLKVLGSSTPLHVKAVFIFMSKIGISIPKILMINLVHF